MRDPLHWMSVRVKLPLLFAGVCLLAFGVGGTIVSSAARRSLESEILARLDAECSARASALDAALTLLTRRAQDFASDGYIRSHVEELEAGDAGAGVAVLGAELTSHLARNKLPLVEAFHDLAVVDRAGRCVACVKSARPLVERWAASAPADPDAPWHSGLLGPDDGVDFAYLLIAVPLRDLAAREVIGRLCCCVRVAAWLDAASAVHAAPSGAPDRPVASTSLRLVDGAGRSLDLPDEPSAASGEHAAFAAAGRRPADVFERSLRIPINGWTLRVEVDEAEALAPVSGLQSRFVLVGAVLALACGALLFFPMRFLVRPHAQLRDAARRVEAGDLGARVPVASSDEIGGLAGAFNAMAVALAERSDRIEQANADLRARKLELVAERDRLNAVISTMRDALIVVGPDGSVVLHNEAGRALIGPLLGGGEPIHAHHDCRLGATTDHCCRECLARPSANARACIVDVGGSTWEVHAQPVAAVPGGPPGRLLVARDVTDRIEQDDRMIHQERLAALGEVAAVMAHELNNPLAAICMFQQMVGDALPADSPHREGVALIGRNAEVCRRTIRELLDYATGARAEVQEVALAESLEDAVRFVRPLSKRARVDVRIEAGAEGVIVAGDEIQIRQIFVNLIMNALQAVQERGEGGSVALRPAAGAGIATIDVVDDGPGVPDTARARLFRPFFTTKARGAGTGLGLATARRIAEMHGGSVDLAETRPGRTVFRVTLRTVAAAAAAAARNGHEAQA